MGGVAKTVSNVIKKPGRALAAGATGGLSEAFQQNPFGGPLPFKNPLNVGLNAALGTTNNSESIPGPFSLDPAQMAGDQAAIKGLGQSQYGETLTGIDNAGKSAQDYAAQTFQKMLPGIAEDYNAGHLLNSTGYQAEAARQASSLSNDVANQVAQQKLAALSGRQGFDTSALQRGLSLEDFTNQANVAKSIGAQMAPQMPSGKATGLAGGVAGAGAGAPIGPMGAALGGLGGLFLGGNANKRGK